MDAGVRLREAGGVISFSALPLCWRVCVINALMFFVATVVLAVSPATVSPQVTGSELMLLSVGLVVVVVVNSLLLRRSLALMDRLIRMMEQVDLAVPAPVRSEPGTVEQMRTTRYARGGVPDHAKLQRLGRLTMSAHGFLFQHHADFAGDVQAFLSDSR